VRTSLKRSSIFHQEPEETPFHERITFPHNIDLCTNKVWVGIVFSQRLDNSAEPRRKRIATCIHSDLMRKEKEG
jgi:hypothetical protein